jgi:DNA-binding winged helix-turn-helix (wHTH) protein/tetratricopeptide (TPR) repeat protein
MNGSRNDSRYLYEFDGFRADPVRRRLSRGGEVVSLTPKAFSILLALLDKRGEVVPKEDLIQQIWPDTFVTEANLTQNISSLRKALGERANDPRLVVTVPGQGYTFVGDVLEIPRDSTGEMPAFVMPILSEPGMGNLTPIALPVMSVASTTSEISGSAETAAPEATPASHASASAFALTPPLPFPTPFPTALEVLAPSSLDDTAARLRAETEAVLVVTPPGPRWGRRFSRSTLVGLLVLALAVIAVPSIYLVRPGALSLSAAPAASAPVRPERPSVAVLDFTNLSGNPAANWLTPAFAEMLRTELATGGKVRLISGDNTGAAAALNLPEDANLRAEALKRLHSVLGADLIVYGTYLAIGESGHDRVRLDVKVLKAPSGEEVARLPELGTASDLIEMVSRTGADLRQKLGWAPPSPAQQKEAQALRPANPEATRLYAEGLAQLRAFDPQGAKNLLTRAADADPKSAVIHSALAQSWADLGHDSRAASEAEKAVELSGSLAKQEQLAIQARFRESKREWKEASELYRTLWTFFPDDLEYGLRLANTLAADGRGSEAQEAVAALRQLPAPKRDDPRIDLAEARVARRAWDPERALRAAKAAEIKGWKLGEEQVVAQALALEGQSSQILGKLDDAIALFHQASALFAKSGNQAQVAEMFTATGETLDDQGKIVEARQKFEEALAIAGHLGSDNLVATELSNLGLLRAEAGDLAQARDQLGQAAALFAKTEDRRLVVRTTYFLAQVSWQAGDVDGARQRYERVLADSRDLHSRIDEAVALEGLGQILARQGRLNDARRSHQQALKIAKEENDPYRTAGIVASLAEVTSGLGDPEGAERLYEQALESRRRLGARLVAAQIQGSLAALAYRRGDLAKSRELSLEELRVAQQVGAGFTTAEALQNLGRTELAQADLGAARQHLERALQMATSFGGQLVASAIRLDLARLELASGRGAPAVRWARESADWYAKQGMPGSQAQALGLLAEGFAREGQLAAAREAAEQARTLSDRSEDGGVQVAVTTSVARIDAAAGAMGSGPKAHLRWAVDQAGKLGLVPAGMEARLALGAVQLVSTTDRDAGRRFLEDLRREAAERGFKLIAQLAEAALAAAPGARFG